MGRVRKWAKKTVVVNTRIRYNCERDGSSVLGHDQVLLSQNNRQFFETGEMIADIRDSQHMEDALKMARQAMLHGETPIGAVLVKDGIVIATGETGVARNGPASHGENSMIESLGHKIWELAPYSTVYTNLEPCIMCIGACINAGIRHIVYGMSAPDGGGYALESINSACY